MSSIRWMAPIFVLLREVQVVVASRDLGQEVAPAPPHDLFGLGLGYQPRQRLTSGDVGQRPPVVVRRSHGP